MIRYAITKIDTDGLRVLALENSKSNLWDTEEQAQHELTALLRAVAGATNPHIVHGDLSKLQVTPVECHPHGTAIRTVIGVDRPTITISPALRATPAELLESAWIPPGGARLSWSETEPIPLAPGLRRCSCVDGMMAVAGGAPRPCPFCSPRKRDGGTPLPPQTQDGP